jgi:hypothetical protein
MDGYDILTVEFSRDALEMLIELFIKNEPKNDRGNVLHIAMDEYIPGKVTLIIEEIS